MNLTAQSLLLQVWERGLHSQTSAQPRLRPICSFGFLCFYVVAGQERPVDQEVGDLARRSSVTSMESTVSSGTQTTVQDDPEQFEVIKQQKEMIEHGIELWVWLLLWLSLLGTWHWLLKMKCLLQMTGTGAYGQAWSGWAECTHECVRNLIALCGWCLVFFVFLPNLKKCNQFRKCRKV